MNYYGVGIPENMDKAFYWFDLVKKWNARSQIYLTQMYATGLGVKKDKIEGLKWLREAAGRGQDAEDGSPWAQLYLGQWYINRDPLGLGSKFDFKLAALWHRRAAEKGLYAAQQNMSHFYEKGIGVSKNIIKAYMWAYIGAQQDVHPKLRSSLRQSEEFWSTLIQGNGFDVDHVNHVNVFYNGFSNMEKVKRNMTPAQIAEAQKLAREWRKAHKSK